QAYRLQSERVASFSATAGRSSSSAGPPPPAAVQSVTFGSGCCVPSSWPPVASPRDPDTTAPSFRSTGSAADLFSGVLDFASWAVGHSSSPNLPAPDSKGFPATAAPAEATGDSCEHSRPDASRLPASPVASASPPTSSSCAVKRKARAAPATPSVAVRK
ncbi:unnamed protein product, partial [Ectocarpus sp. 12 AP-2014]